MELTRAQIRKGIILSVSVSVVAIILVMALTQNKVSLGLFARIDAAYLLMAFMVTLIFWLFKTLKIKVLTNSLDREVPLYKVFKIYLASAFVAHVTPSSSGGLPFQIYFLHKEGLPLGKTTALSILDNMLTFIFFMFTTPVLIVVWGKYLNLGISVLRLFYIAVLLIVPVILGILFLMFNTQLAKSFINWLTGLTMLNKLISTERMERFRTFVGKEIEYFNEGIDLLVREKKNMALVIIYTVFYWLFYVSLAPLLLKGLGIKVAVPLVILAQLVFNFIQPIIPTPGGSGGAELSFAYLFRSMIPNNLLGIFVAIWRFYMFYASLIVGGIFFIQLVQGTDYLHE